MLRRTKIVATIGPATEDPKVIDKLIEAGVDVVRLNFSHDRHEVHVRRAETVSHCASSLEGLVSGGRCSTKGRSPRAVPSQAIACASAMPRPTKAGVFDCRPARQRS